MGFLWSVGSFLVSYPYIHAVIILIIAILLAEFLLYFFKHVVEKIVEKTKTKVDNQIVFKIENPIIAIVILVGILLALRKILDSGMAFENFIKTIIIFVITYMFIGISSIFLDYWQKIKLAEQGESKEFHHEVLPLMKSLVKIVLVMIAIVLILQLWGVKVGALLASIGIAGVILGFAFQDTMKNIFGGIALLSDNSLHKHDVIKLETGEIGEVMEVSLRSTKLKTFDNDFLMVPNGTLANSRFINYAQPTSTMRITIPVSVAYGSNAKKVKEVLLSVLKGRNDILHLPRQEVRFVKMNDFSLDFELLFYIHNYKEKFTIADSITTLLYNALSANGIEIPFPTRTIYTESQENHVKLKNKIKNMKRIKKIERENTLAKKPKKKKTAKKKVIKKKVAKKK